jgi:hypothetical protein
MAFSGGDRQRQDRIRDNRGYLPRIPASFNDVAIATGRGFKAAWPEKKGGKKAVPRGDPSSRGG